MKDKISEMIKDLDENYIKQLKTKEYLLDELEVKRISNKVIQRYDKKTKNKHQKMKKMIIIAVAAICSYTTLYAINQMSTLDSLFKENANNLSESGKALEVKSEHQDIKITVKGIIGYEKVMSLIYEIEKTNNVPFEGNTLSFYSYIEIEDQGKIVKYVIKDNREIKSERTPTKRQYVATISNYFDNVENIKDDEENTEEIKLGNVVDFTHKKMKFVVEEVAEHYYSEEDKPDLDLAQYLESHPYVETQDITEEESNLLYYLDDEVVEKTKPLHSLKNKKLGLVLYNRRPTVKIDNIGFIDGKLHIITQNMLSMYEKSYKPRLDEQVVVWDRGMLVDGPIRVKLFNRKNKGQSKTTSLENYVIEIRDKDGNWIGPQYANYNRRDYKKLGKYEIYNIKDIDELRQYTISARLDYNEKVVQDRWEMPFEMDRESESKKITYDGLINDKIGEIDEEEVINRWRAEKIELSNVYVSISLKCQNPTREDPPFTKGIKLIMKNQEEIVIVNPLDKQYDALTNQKNNSDIKECYIYKNQLNDIINIDAFFIKAIDMSQIESIQIGEHQIPVNKN